MCVCGVMWCDVCVQYVMLVCHVCEWVCNVCSCTHCCIVFHPCSTMSFFNS